ncbi:MAG: hypothetical protein A3F17_01070 [Gammaproteobacteria bacterium RIFCSPHIGHO2_12_FULL_41_15]|nr:MAG: hypothetical protein A3F17_01070 [Gammaproteobacteria bacterium RIFCSPHIGHO2_12_FULL_41_15]
MRVLVSIKPVLDPNMKLRLKPEGAGIDLNQAKRIINPFDEIALEEALRLKESGKATEVMIVSIGNLQTQETLRHGLALGADSALLIQTERYCSSLMIAKILKAIVLRELPTLMFLGKQAIDTDNNQVGQMLAGLLNWPQGTFVSRLELQANEVMVTRELDEGLETLKLRLPAVVTVDLRLNTPRYASLPNIVKAKQKSLAVITLEELGLDLAQPNYKIVNTSLPISSRKKIKVNSVEELIEKLKQEAKLL